MRPADLRRSSFWVASRLSESTLSRWLGWRVHKGVRRFRPYPAALRQCHSQEAISAPHGASPDERSVAHTCSWQATWRPGSSSKDANAFQVPNESGAIAILAPAPDRRDSCDQNAAICPQARPRRRRPALARGHAGGGPHQGLGSPWRPAPLAPRMNLRRCFEALFHNFPSLARMSSATSCAAPICSFSSSVSSTMAPSPARSSRRRDRAYEGS